MIPYQKTLEISAAFRYAKAMAGPSDSEARDEILTLRVRPQTAQAARKLAARHGTALSAFLERIVENVVSRDGDIDPRQILLREIEVKTLGSVFALADQVLLPLLKTVSDFGDTFEYFECVADVLKAQARYVANCEEDLETFFKVVEGQASYDLPDLLISEEVKIAIAKFLEARNARSKPPTLEYVAHPNWKPMRRKNQNKGKPKGGTNKGRAQIAENNSRPSR